MRVLLIVSLCFFCHGVFAQAKRPVTKKKTVSEMPSRVAKSSSPTTEKNMPEASENSNEVFTIVETQPEFPGGQKQFSAFLSRNLRYPDIARENNIQGRVVVTFVVERDGSITDIKVLRAIGGGCDEEAVRVLGLSPKWKPGAQNGRNVRVQFTVPISFSLGNQ